MSELDLQSYDRQYGQLTTDATQKLAEGADEVYARLRTMEQDTVELAEKDAEKGIIANASVPNLIQPFTNTADFDNWVKNGMKSPRVDGTTSPNWEGEARDKMDANMKQVAIGMLDAWVEAEGKRADEQQAEDRVLTREAFDEYFEKIRTNSPESYLNTHSVMAAFVISAGLTSMIAGNESLTDANKVAFDSVQNSVNEVAQMVPSDMRAELGLIGAMFANTATFQAALLTVGGGEGAQNQQLDQQFAEKYAQRLLKMVNDPEFEKLLTTVILAKAPGEGKISEGQMNEWKGMLKLGLMISGLALFYKAETGGMSGTEVAAMLKNPDLANAGSKAPLLAEIARQLEGLSPAARQATLEGIMSFIDSKPKLEAMMDPLRVMEGLSAGSEYDQQASVNRAA